MNDYSYIPSSNTEIDIEICNKRNEIEKLREQVRQLELQKSKQNTDYVGRIFQMKGMEYIYVTSIDKDGSMYGLQLEDFEHSVDIYRCVLFKPEDIEKEVTNKEIQCVFRNSLRWDKLKEILD